MKKFLNIIVLSLCLITPSQADDIRDFQIEGISIGDRSGIKNKLKKENINLALTNMVRTDKIKKLNRKLNEVDKVNKYITKKEITKRESKNYKGSVENLYQERADSVVYIVNPAGRGGSGSGFLIDRTKGHIITNWHVVEGTKKVYVWFKPKNQNDMERDKLIQQPSFQGTVIKIDRKKDLALIKIEKVPANIKPLKFGKTPDIPVGSTVYAIGHPQGLTWTFNSGMVTQIRTKYRWRGGDDRHMANVIQHEVPLNPGNSGGPLFNEMGQLVGVNSFSDSHSSELINFSVAVEEVENFLKEKITKKKTTKYIQKKKKQTWIKKKSKEKTNWIKKKSKKKQSSNITEGMKKDYPKSFSDDHNKNGIEDTWYVDENRNGKIDTAFIDDNEDGIIEAILIDNDENGKWDYLFVDKDLDGNPDYALIDKDQDGEYDSKAYDSNQDGEWDRFENLKTS